MDTTGERRRRVWRWAVVVWALAVAVAGCLTLWMQDSTDPGGPYVWEQADPDETFDPPPCPTPDTEDGIAQACAYLKEN